MLQQAQETNGFLCYWHRLTAYATTGTGDQRFPMLQAQAISLCYRHKLKVCGSSGISFLRFPMCVQAARVVGLTVVAVVPNATRIT